MKDTINISTAPTILFYSVGEGEKLELVFKSNYGDDVTFSMNADPIPSGAANFKSSGIFDYTPKAIDVEAFNVKIIAEEKHGSSKEELTINITPIPKLPSEFKYIEHKTANTIKPNPGDEFYQIISIQDDDKMVFNNTVEYEDKDIDTVKIQTKKISISGVNLTFKRGNQNYKYLHSADKPRNDLRKLILCADEIVIADELNLPGTDVFIYARILRFIDNGKLITTPLQLKMQSNSTKRNEGLTGQKGGDVHLFIEELEALDNNEVIICTIGADGQAARLGQKGEPGKPLQIWNGKYTVENTWFSDKTIDWNQLFQSKLGEAKPVYARIVNNYTEVMAGNPQSGAGGKVRNVSVDVGEKGTNAYPTDGEPPKVLPGAPGQGGDGGSIISPYFSSFGSKVNQNHGRAGDMAQDIEASLPGQPRISCHVEAEILGAPAIALGEKERGDLKILNLIVRTSPGQGAKAPSPNAPEGKDGEHTLILVGNGVDWLHPAIIKAFIPYLRDMILAGYEKDIEELIDKYISTLNVFVQELDENPADLGQTLEWSNLLSELKSLQQLIDSPYDYFGNPAGWVPFLSFESNLNIYEREIKDSIHPLFFAYWVEHNQNKKIKAETALYGAIQQLEKENNEALKNYNSGLQKLIKLNEKIDIVKGEIDKFKKSLIALEKELLSKVKDNLAFENLLRSSTKILGGLMQLIPVGQPVLGAIGKSVTVISDIDLNKPFDSATDLAGAFSSVAKETLLPKVSGLLGKFTEQEKDYAEDKKIEKEKDPEKAKLEAEVAKKKFADKVKTYMDEQKKAQDDVMKAFSNFSVKEDEIKKRLKQVEADCPEYQDIVKEMEKLNKKKSAIQETLIGLLQIIEDSTTTLLTNQFSQIEFRYQLDAILEQLSPEAQQYANAMGNRARKRMQKYMYYLLKSYQYLMIEDLSVVDFRLTKVFEKFAEILNESPNGMLNPDQYKIIRGVFDDQLKTIQDEIINYYTAHPFSTNAVSRVSLNNEQLRILNKPTGEVNIDLMAMGYIDLTQDQVRIAGIETIEIELESPPSKSDPALNLNLIFEHSGTSQIRQGGMQYLFRSGDYSLAFNRDENETKNPYRNDKMHWGTTLNHSGEGLGQLVHMKPNPATESLVKSLIGSETNKNSEVVLNFYPSAWADIRIQSSHTPPQLSRAIKRLVFNINYVYTSLNNKLGTVHIRVPENITPYIQCSDEDLNGRKDGRGSFLRTFNKELASEIKFTAPSIYGSRPFLGWRILDDKNNSEPLEDGNIPLIPLTPERTINLNLNESLHYIIEPFYGPDTRLTID